MGDDHSAPTWEDIGPRLGVAAGVIAAIAVLWPRSKKKSLAMVKDPTHKIVCQCTCTAPLDPNDPEGSATGGTQTFVDRPEGCESLEGVDCTHNERPGTLKGCKPVAVPTSFRGEESIGPEDVAPVNA
jgi:hypothetical protein